MRSLLLVLGLTLGLSPLPGHGQDPCRGPAAEEATAEKPATGPMRVERGAGQLALFVPRAEELHFKARGGSGEAVFRSKVAKSRPARSLDPADDEGENPEVGILRIDVEADAMFYSLDATLETRVLPQVWPRIVHRYVRTGAKSKRREVRIGVREGTPTVGYRKDTDEGAPAGTRIWRDERYREAPTSVVDTVSALHLARTLVLEGLPSAQFPMIDRLQLWRMHARRGEQKRIKTPAGTFDAVEVKLEALPWPGEERDEDGDRVKFKGLFGIEGTIHVWMDKRSGTPIRIEGEVPTGLMDIDLVLELQSYKGTPASFRKVGKRSRKLRRR